jgi:hypothetical protein
MTEIVHSHLVRPILVIAAFQLTDRFQFSRPSRDPRGEVMAGAPRGRLSSRAFSAGTKRSGMGTDRLPASDFGFPPTSLPPTWVTERRTRMRLASTSTSSTFSPVSSPNLKPE